MADTLFTNANVVLEGSADLQRSLNVLVTGNSIDAVSPNPIHHSTASGWIAYHPTRFVAIFGFIPHFQQPWIAHALRFWAITERD
jgi:hypothetical protein